MREFDCDAVLFDLDGVLVDSTETIEKLWHEWAARHRIDFIELMKIAHGRRTVETVQMIAPHLDVDRELEALEGAESSMTDGVRKIAGATELVRSLPEDAWAIVTSGTFRTAATRIGFAELPMPKALVSADDVERGKPAPDAYLLAAERLGVLPQRCVVIEDAPAGIRAAHAGSMPVIAVTTTYERDTLQEADSIAEQLADIEILTNAEEQGFRLRIRVKN